MSETTGTCKKCTTEIPLKAERCPQCGYEPGKAKLGGIGKILGGILLIGAVFQILGGILSFLTVLGGVPITSALLAGVIFVGLGGLQAAVAEWLGRFNTYYATEEGDEIEVEEESKQSVREALERGRERRKKRQEWIDQLSPLVFTSVIIAGVGLVFLTIVIAGMETEIAGVPPEDLFILPFAMSLFVLTFAVLGDIGRVNRIYGTNHKWWVWVLPSMIPIVGFIPALGWVLRRRKTEKTREK